MSQFDSDGNLRILGNFGIGSTATPSGLLEIMVTGTTAPFMVSSDVTADGDLMIITSDGNIGFGTTLPREVLELASVVYVRDGAAPPSTLNRLYAVGGDIYWDGTQLNAPSAGGWTDGGTTVYVAAGTDNVGFGTSSSSATIEVVEQSEPILMISSDATGDGDLFFVSSIGNVGIGSVVPAELLDIAGRLHMAQTTAPTTTTDKLYNVGGNIFWNGTQLDASGANAWMQSGGNTYLTTSTDNVGFGTSDPSATFEIIEQGEPILMVSDDATGDGDLFIITSDGNVGIGTTTPQREFHVYDSSGGVSWRLEDGSGNYSEIQKVNNLNRFRINMNGTGAFEIDSSRNVGIGSNLPLAHLHVGTGDPEADLATDDVYIASDLEVDGSIYLADGTELNDIGDLAGGGWMDGGTTVYLSTSTDNVGMGTTSADANLEIILEGTDHPFMISSDATGDGDVLLVDSDGNLGLDYNTPFAKFNAGVDAGDTGLFFNADAGGINAYTGQLINMGGFGFTTGNMIFSNMLLSGGGLPSLSSNLIDISLDKETTGGATTDSGGFLRLNRSVTETAGSYTLTGPLVQFSSFSGGTATDSARILQITQTGTLSTGEVVYIENRASGDSLRIDDVASDTTPFIVDASGNVGIGSSVASASLEIVENAITPFMISSDPTGDGDLVIVASVGNVGIGSIVPAELLDVAGRLHMAQVAAPSTTTDKLYNVSGNLFWNGTQLDTAAAGDQILEGNTDVEVIDTGADGRVVWTTEGTERGRITAAGNVGIGSTIPLAQFQVGTGDPDESWISGTNDAYVADDLEVDGAIYLADGTALDSLDDLAGGGWTDGGTDVYLTLSTDNVGLGTTDPTATFELIEQSETPFMISSDATGDGDFVIVTSIGNVGVGSVVPAELLDIAGRVHMAQVAAPSTTTDKLYNVSGNLFWNGTQLDTAATGDQIQEGNTDVEVIDAGADGRVVWTTEGTERGRITAAGNVGIGTSVPLAHFVVGDGDPDESAITGTNDAYIAGDLEVDGVIYGDGSGLTNVSVGGWTDGGVDVYLTDSTDNIGLGTTDPTATLEIIDQGETPFMISSTSTADGNLFIVLTNGNVGAGDETPDQKFHLVTADTVSTHIVMQEGTGETNAAALGALTDDAGDGTFTYLAANAHYPAGSVTRFNTGDVAWTLDMSSRTGQDFFQVRRISSGGTISEYIHIDSVGNMGISTDTPLANLHVGDGDPDEIYIGTGGDIYVGDDLEVDGAIYLADGTALDSLDDLAGGGWTDGGTDVYLTASTDNVGFGTTDPTATIEIIEQSEHPFMISSDATGDGDLIMVTSVGNFGIGTNSPVSPLHLVGGIGNLLNGVTFGDGDTGFYESSDDVLRYEIGGTTSLTVAATSVNVHGTLQVDNGGADLTADTTHELVLRDSTNAQEFQIFNTDSGANDEFAGLGFRTNSNVFTIETEATGAATVRPIALMGGNVGIGSTVPLAQLHIGDGDPDEAWITDTNDVYIADDLEVDGVIYGDGSGLTNISAGGWTDGGTDVYLTASTDNVGFGTTDPTATIEIIEQSEHPFMISSDATADGDMLLVQSDGNVGIGTAIASTRLRIVQGADDSGISLLGFDDQSDQSAHLYLDSSGTTWLESSGSSTINISAQNTNTVRFDSGGMLVIDNFGVDFGTNADFTMTYDETTDDQFELSDGANLFMTIADQGTTADFAFNVNDLFIDDGSNVGVGTTIPLAMFVVGDGNPDESAITGTDDAYIAGDLEVDGVFYGDGSGLTNVSAGGWTESAPDVYLTTSTNNVGLGTIDPTATLEIIEQSEVPLMVSSDATGDGDLFILTSDGNIGLNTTTPGSDFHVYATGAPHAQIILENNYNNDPSLVLSANRTGQNNALGGLTGQWNRTTVTAIQFRSGVDTTNKDEGEMVLMTRGASDANQQIRMRIGQEGNIGIGSTESSPDALLDITVQNTTYDPFMISSDATADGDLLIINTAGVMGIGTTDPGTTGGITIKDKGPNSFKVIGESAIPSSQVFYHASNATSGAVILTKTRGTQGSPTAVSEDDDLGLILFQGYDTGNSGGASITAAADAEWGSGADSTDAPARLEFATAPDGSQTTVDRMVIKSTGNVGVGTTLPLAMFVVGDGNPDESAITGTDDAYIAGDLEVDGVLYGDGSGLSNISAGGWTDGGSDVYVTASTDNVGIGTIVGSAMVEIVQDSSDHYFMVSSDATADGDIFYIDSSGNIGAGTTAPDRQFVVYRDTSTNFPAVNIEQDGSGDATLEFELTSTQAWSMGIDNSLTGDPFVIADDVNLNSNQRIVIDNAGNVAVGTFSPLAELHVGDGDPEAALSVDDVYITSDLEVDGSIYLADGTGARRHF